jgi:hypothetical protein
MNLTYWILQGLLAAVMTMAGLMKATQGKAKLSGDPKMAWVEDFSDGAVRGIGGLEVAGAAGLILPWALDIAPVLTPIAAVGVAVLMAGAAITHLRRGETAAIVPTLVLGAIAVVIAIGRFADL